MKNLIIWLILWLLSIVTFKVLSIIGFVVNIIIILFHKNRIENFAAYFKTLAIGEDQVGGSYMYRTEDWTVSSYNYYLGVIKKKRFVYYFMRFVDFFPRILNIQEEHCKESYYHEKETLNIKEYVIKHSRRNSRHTTSK